jgi:hypothetical protein
VRVKILFLSEGDYTCDYQRDMTFHGLRTLFGPDVIDVPRIDTMYEGIDTTQLYGRGFTLYGLLPDDSDVDRTNIPHKIATKYYDAVIFGSIHRDRSHLDAVASMYSPDRIALIDGEDHVTCLRGLPGTYFKRELAKPSPGVHPIQFAIPASKILPSMPAKSRLIAPMDPLDKSTYVYTTEAAYYAQYAESYYAVTMRKTVWDCLRHYEIMSQWCIPYFRCLDQCPSTVLSLLPKRDLRLVQECFDAPRLLRDSTLRAIYDDLIGYMMTRLRATMATERLATYVLDTIGVATKEFSACS